MKSWKFIMNEAKFMMKSCRDLLLPIIGIFIPSFSLSAFGLQEVISEISLPPEVKSVMVGSMVEGFLTFFTSTIVMTLIFLVSALTNNEKNDKVFEQIFLIPMSPLKLIFCRFVALIPMIVLFLSAIYFLVFSTIAIIAGNVSLLIVLRSFISLLMLGLLLSYMLFLNMLLISAKFRPIFMMTVVLPSSMSVFGLSSIFVNQYTPTESLCLATIIISIILATASLVESMIVKDRIVERVITT